MKLIATAALLALAFASPSFGQETVPNSAEIVKNADWGKMESVTIELIEHEFNPKNLKLKADKPYRLIIKNGGDLGGVGNLIMVYHRLGHMPEVYLVVVSILLVGFVIDRYVRWFGHQLFPWRPAEEE